MRRDIGLSRLAPQFLGWRNSGEGAQVATDETVALWPDDESVQSDRLGKHYRMANGREYVVSSSLLEDSPDILRTATVPLTRYIDDHPEWSEPLDFLQR